MARHKKRSRHMPSASVRSALMRLYRRNPGAALAAVAPVVAAATSARPGENQIPTQIIKRANPSRYKRRAQSRRNPSAGKRRVASRNRIIKKWRRTTQGLMLIAPSRSMTFMEQRKLARLISRSDSDTVRRTSRRNPSKAWGKARKVARGKWLKRRFGYNPDRRHAPKRSARTGRFVRRGRR